LSQLSQAPFSFVFVAANAFHVRYLALLALHPYFGSKVLLRDVILQFSPLDLTLQPSVGPKYNFSLQYGFKNLDFSEAGTHSSLERFCVYEIIKTLQTNEKLL
jgi:hypothetical protein